MVCGVAWVVWQDGEACELHVFVTGDAEAVAAGKPWLPGAAELSHKVDLALQALQTLAPTCTCPHLPHTLTTYPNQHTHTLLLLIPSNPHPPSPTLTHPTHMHPHLAAGAAPYAPSPPPLVAHIVAL